MSYIMIHALFVGEKLKYTNQGQMELILKTHHLWKTNTIEECMLIKMVLNI